MGTKNGEMSMSDKKSEVVLVVCGEERDAKGSNLDVKSTSPMSYSSPEIGRFSPSPNRPPKIPTTQTLVPGEGLSRRNSLSRSMYSKPKSRFGEQSVPLDSKVFEEMSSNSPIRITSNSNRSSPNNNMIPSITTNPKTPLIGSPVGVAGVDEQEEIYKKVSSRKKLKYRRVKITVLFEWVVLLCLLGFLIASLTVGALKHFMIWGVEIWKWCVLVTVIFCGMLFTTWFMHFVVLLIELNYLLKKKVLYFVHGLKKSVQFCIWMILVLSTWVLLFNNRGIKRSATANRALDSVTWTIVSLLIGGFLWLLKTLLLKILASSFNVNTYFDRIQESIFHQYVILTLSGPPIFGAAEMISRTNSASQLSYRSRKKKKEGKKKEVIDMNKIHQMKQEKVSAWTMKMLIDVISKSGLSTLSNAFDESNYGGVEQTDKEMTNEMEAIAAAYHIFNNVAHPGCDKIYEMDLRRFMIKEEVDLVLPLIDVADTGQIDKKTLTDWLVNVYNGRKALAHALNDTKTAVKQLDKIVTVVLAVIMIILWLVLMEIASTKVLVLLSSQLVVAAFIFGNTCKTIFEAIIFVFVMHPFDVGDRCVIDGVQMIVEEMNILTTIFLRFDNEKIYYPNSVLATKPISNFYRSPDMGDSLEFSIDFTTPVEKIGALKDQLKKYLERTPQYWHPNHNMVVKEIENVNKIKMALFFNHTMNFQNYGEKSRRKTELVLEMKKIFEELCIIYNLLPQDVRLTNPEATTIGPPK